MGANYQSIIFFVAIIGVFYFLIIRPQKKRQTEQVQLMNELKPGAEIQTIGGIYGQIVSIDDDDRVVLAVYDGSELEIAKRAIARIVTPTESDDTDDDATDEDDSAPELMSGESDDAAADSTADDVAAEPAPQKDDSQE